MGPTQAPPAGNTPTPVHVGTTAQIKDGGLSLDGLSVFGGGYFQGNVVVGVVTPTKMLDVGGDIKASGTICDGSNNCIGESSAGGVSKIIAGSNIIINPSSGLGDVTINSSAVRHKDGSNCPSGKAARGVDANGNAQIR